MGPLRATQRARAHKRTSLTRRRAHAAAGPTPVFETGREGEIGVPAEQGPVGRFIWHSVLFSYFLVFRKWRSRVVGFNVALAG